MSLVHRFARAVFLLGLILVVGWGLGGSEVLAVAQGPSPLSVAPFVVLLLCIALCPLLAPHFWHYHYAKVAVGLGLITALYYVAGVHYGYAAIIHAGFEWFSFIALLAGLFVSTGGIVITVDRKATVLVNVGMLLFGAVLANFIGTTGAAMLLIRPFMRVNKGRLRAFHVVFFILMVANVGGSLTPIGDLPLFLGFLKGIDFFLFMQLNLSSWLLALMLLALMFFVLDSRAPAAPDGAMLEAPTGRISLEGGGGT
jgi:Na+/H+ antiporter NhaD/arsenite permease-like protein